ncbi:helix-turn-helix domain-containing protein [Neorhizobium sp. NPDC001467]|uniref:helix-turn-helix domain-containing protein n=1 Tax=Neorhizobium sp. NPDC001467 TaxID=3390595 RepID=UPI003D01DF40
MHGFEDGRPAQAGQKTAHADHVYASLVGNAAASSPVVASWRRCMVLHHLAPEETRLPERLTDIQFHHARQASGHLIAEATDELDRLFSLVGRSGCCLLLTDRHGVALERRGSAGDDNAFHDLGLWTSTIWTEESVGTNGIGTALADRRAVSIFRDQHFLSANTRLSCTTAPIRDHLGELAAALDISTCREDVGEAVLSILAQTVRDAAMRIELNLFRAAFPGSRFVVVPGAGHGAAALIAVDRNDMVIGATKAARLALSLDDAALRAGLPAADALNEGREDADRDLAAAERAALMRVLSRTSGNVSQAARTLGISRATLHRKMKRFGLR